MKEKERRRQLQNEIDWLHKKIKTVKKETHKKDLERQVLEREYELHLADFKKHNNE